jgi:3-oxoadipate enol-lactonase
MSVHDDRHAADGVGPHPSALPQASTLNRPGAAIRYWLSGADDAPLIVFSHGAAIDHRTWEPQAGFARRYRVVTYDIRGHGVSLATKAFDFNDAVDDLLALLDVLDATSAVLVGQSMGGNISQEVAYRQPGRVTALVLVGCACNTWRLTGFERWLGKVAIGLIALYPPDALNRSTARRSSVVPSVRQYIAHTTSAMPPRQQRAVLRSLFYALHPDPSYRTPVPELLIRGEYDRLGNAEKVMPHWARRDPYASYVVIDNAGHVANQDNPSQFNDVLGAFLGRVAPP